MWGVHALEMDKNTNFGNHSNNVMLKYICKRAEILGPNPKM